MLQNGLAIITDTYHRFDGTGSYFILFYIALFYICYKEKEQRTFLVYSSLFLLAVLLNPFLAGFIGDHLIGGYVYWRCFWILPIVTVLANAATSLTMSVNLHRFRILIASACAVLMILCGGFMFTSSNYQIAQNPYKVSTDTIEICEIIQADDSSGDTKALVANELISYIRQYDASIKLAYGRYPMTVDWQVELSPELDDFFTSAGLYFEINKEAPNIPLLVESARKIGVNYYVWYNDHPITNDLISTYGMQVVGRTQNYTVLSDSGIS
ncbi:MAG: hypothetical protein RR716_07690 [Christensenellaceae bacterium]